MTKRELQEKGFSRSQAVNIHRGMTSERAVELSFDNASAAQKRQKSQRSDRKKYWKKRQFVWEDESGERFRGGDEDVDTHRN